MTIDHDDVNYVVTIMVVMTSAGDPDDVGLGR